MNTTTIANATEYRNLPLALLTESKTNPRRTFEDDSLKELADFVPGNKIGRFVPLPVLWPRVSKGVWQ